MRKWTAINREVGFDFEVGEAVKSPCLDCRHYAVSFPTCINKCRRIEAFQQHLCGCLSTCKSVPAGEGHAIGALR